MKWPILLTLFILVSCDKPISDGRTVGISNPDDRNIEEQNPDGEINYDLSSIFEIADHYFSQISRQKGSQRLSYREEQLAVQDSQLDDSNYFPTPRVDISDEGTDASSPVEKRSSSGDLCGLEQASSDISEAIVHCSQTKNSSWSGLENGNHGEGDWLLVVRNEVQGGEAEIWLDTRTGLLWSDVTTHADWCQASGNNESDDSICSRQVDSNICQSNAYLNAKGGLNGQHVAWRLPTRNDWLQADINGARFVFLNREQLFWSATVNSQNREQAWLYHGARGTLHLEDRAQSYAIRCVGRIVQE